MDSAGFLIMHEDFLAHSEKPQDLEYVHITNKEKNIAEHLITNGYLKKRECRNLKEIKKQSFYEVDLPDEGVDVLTVETAAVNTNSTRLLALMLI